MKILGSVLLTLAVGVVGASPAFAQTVKGTNIVAAAVPVTTKLASGKTHIFLADQQLCQTADPKHPLNGASGNCPGGCVVDAAGAATCMGSCTWVDEGGDMAFLTWDGSATSGGWKLVGGSGKWKTAKGQGTWKSRGVSAANVNRNDWEGTITMK